MDRRRVVDGAMAPVLAKLVKLLAIFCFTAAISIIAHSAVWGVLAFTHVRQHGLAAVTNPERVVEAPGSPQPVGAKSIAPTAPAETSEAAEARSTSADTALAAISGTATAVGVGSLCLLPIVLFTAFVTSLVRCPRATAASMGGVLWSLGLVALVLPWSSFFPQVPWEGLFRSYTSLVADVAELESHGGPFRAVPILSNVGVPIFAITVLIGIVWRCGEALHQELLAAESLLVDPTLERDAAATAARGAFVPGGRAAASLAATTANEQAGMAHAARSGDDADEPAPRRLI